MERDATPSRLEAIATRGTRAERRRAARAKINGEDVGYIGCKTCGSTQGTYVERTKAFMCNTPGCEGARLKTVTIEVAAPQEIEEVKGL